MEDDRRKDNKGMSAFPYHSSWGCFLKERFKELAKHQDPKPMQLFLISFLCFLDRTHAVGTGQTHTRLPRLQLSIAAPSPAPISSSI